eukprot:TRINITY_DN60565_c0_g1_i2.p3 TRINITY_DN60565_c0_g1~~TRINITY_DN60565_c0_g1_i2.p3  ORF type:complete len:106 (-),score=15.99 TRINITY_DN60565_c0_g1_i2:45-362(-)
MIRRPPRSTQGVSSAASDVYKRQGINAEYMGKKREVQEFAKQHGFIDSIMTSAKNGENVTKGFQLLLSHILKNISIHSKEGKIRLRSVQLEKRGCCCKQVITISR